MNNTNTLYNIAPTKLLESYLSAVTLNEPELSVSVSLKLHQSSVNVFWFLAALLDQDPRDTFLQNQQWQPLSLLSMHDRPLIKPDWLSTCELCSPSYCQGFCSSSKEAAASLTGGMKTA